MHIMAQTQNLATFAASDNPTNHCKQSLILHRYQGVSLVSAN